MVRFLSLPPWTTRHRAQVVAHGGATLGWLAHLLTSGQVHVPSTMIIIHAGTNNINKGKVPEDRALAACKAQMKDLVRALRQSQTQKNIAVAISALVTTKSDLINHRVEEINRHWQDLSQNMGWLFIPHHNITPGSLQDFVHLNTRGERIFFDNLKSVLQ